MTRPATRRFTIVSFHAHPDDEALLTSGTLAAAAAEGHRVVLVVATAGERGLVADRVLGGRSLAEVRMAELRASADAIGCARVVLLGYGDSAFAEVDPNEAAHQLAAILDGERADVLTIYDPNGGYGHPDHVQVHDVGARAAKLAGTPVVLEATIDRDLLRRVVAVLRPLRRLFPGLDLPDFSRSYAPRSVITHRVDVRAHLDAKRSALAAHVTQGTAESGLRTIGFLLRLPRPLFRVALGHEWFVEHGRATGGVLSRDILDSSRRQQDRHGHLVPVVARERVGRADVLVPTSDAQPELAVGRDDDGLDEREPESGPPA
jgi:LmbE family N-acetylglucosaminyl deacetylase